MTKKNDKPIAVIIKRHKDVDQKQVHRLQFTWKLWFLKSEKSRPWEECLIDVAEMTSVEEFWGVFNHLEPASSLSVGSDYYLFKDGIKPMWDDPNNEHGGRWFIPLDRFSRHSKLDGHWTEIIMAMVGEQFGDDSDYVCGAVASLRFKVDKISLWTRDAITPEGRQANKRIGAIIKERLGLSQKESDEMRYEEHREASKRSQLRRPI